MAGRTRTTTPQQNRMAYHQGRVDAARSQKERLNAYCGWVMAECRSATPTQVDEVIDRIAGIARDLNERT